MSFSALVAFNRSVVGVDAPIAQVFGELRGTGWVQPGKEGGIVWGKTEEGGEKENDMEVDG